ncbi:MAG: dTDP-4-dehydrorhamnose 3,5-epimerase [Planctomycetota bacterium]
MKFHETPLSGVLRVELTPISDDRGWFARTYCTREMRDAGIHDTFVQTNHSQSRHRGTLRGLHYQIGPHAEAKLIRCTKGRIFDVAVDIRAGSPTFGEWFGVELTDSNYQMLYIPQGFAHGYQTLEDNAEATYSSSSYYEPGSERQIRYDETRIGVQWPVDPPILSPKDESSKPLEVSFQGISVDPKFLPA